VADVNQKVNPMRSIVALMAVLAVSACGVPLVPFI